VAARQGRQQPAAHERRDTVAKAEAQLGWARAGGDAAKIAEAEAAVSARREGWPRPRPIRR
jgi:hypothetical protein